MYGEGTTHQCRDWTQIRAFVEDNYQLWKHEDHFETSESKTDHNSSSSLSSCITRSVVSLALQVPTIAQVSWQALAVESTLGDPGQRSVPDIPRLLAYANPVRFPAPWHATTGRKAAKLELDNNAYF